MSSIGKKMCFYTHAKQDNSWLYWECPQLNPYHGEIMVKYGEVPSTLKKNKVSWAKTRLDQSAINYPLFLNLCSGKIPRRDWNCSWKQGGGKIFLRKLIFSCSTFYSKIWQKRFRQCFNGLSISRNAHQNMKLPHSILSPLQLGQHKKLISLYWQND